MACLLLHLSFFCPLLFQSQVKYYSSIWFCSRWAEVAKLLKCFKMLTQLNIKSVSLKVYLNFNSQEIHLKTNINHGFKHFYYL